MVLGKFTIIYTLAFLQRRCFLNYHGLIRLSSAANVSFTVSITVLFLAVNVCFPRFCVYLIISRTKTWTLTRSLTIMHVKEEIIGNLKQFDIGDKFSYLPLLPRASVLIPLFVRSGRLYTLLTLRSKEVT